MVLAALLVFLWQAPKFLVRCSYIHSQHSAGKRVDAEVAATLENENRRTLAYVLGGAFLAIGAFCTWRNARTADDRQLTERFTRAIEQLGAVHANGYPKLEIRLGAIYALERIAKDSPKDHWPIMEVLTAYVRENAPWREEEAARAGNPEPQEGGTGESQERPKPPVDIQAILTVLGRRNPNYDMEDYLIRLEDTDLRGVDLFDAHLDHVFLKRAHLEQAVMGGAQLRSAVLWEAHIDGAAAGQARMEGANLAGASLERTVLLACDLRESCLAEAILRNAILQEARLDGADMSEADLSGALLGSSGEEDCWGPAILEDVDLTGTCMKAADITACDLRRTTGLTQEQIDSAIGDETTKLPAHLRMPDSWKTKPTGE